MGPLTYWRLRQSLSQSLVFVLRNIIIRHAFPLVLCLSLMKTSGIMAPNRYSPSSLEHTHISTHVLYSLLLRVLVLTVLGRRRRKVAPKRAAPSWIKHLHVNGTIYYSLDCRNWSFRRIITAEDVTNLDNRDIIEYCGLEYHQWLEEADLEDLPDDLELIVFFDNPQSKTPIGTFVSHGKEIKFACCPQGGPPEDASVTSSYFLPRFE
jgi:hypothetical protein